VTQANKELRLSQSILNNAKTSNVLGVMFTPIFNDTSKLQALFKINRDRLRDAAQVIVRFAEFHGLEYYKPAAGLYIWIRLSPKCNSWTEEENSVRNCAGRGVLIGSGADYADSSPGWFRVTFAVPRADLLTGLQRIEEALNYVGKFQNASAKKSDFDWWRWLEAPTTWGWSRV
jgi:DNA-binding transcriptional MocR family regulator